MPLTDAERDWVRKIGRRYPDADAVENAIAAAAAHETARNEALADAQAQLARVRDELDAAQKELFVKIDGQTAVPVRSAEEGVLRADSEVESRDIRQDSRIARGETADTAEEVSDAEEIAIIARLEAAHQRLIELQTHMLSAIDDSGAPLFSEDDVRRELWTPLVREGVIPDNLVSDRFSEQALAIEGSMTLYREQLEQYSSTHTAAGDIARATADVIKVGATAVSGFAQGIVGVREGFSGEMTADTGETMKLRWKVMTGQAEGDDEKNLKDMLAENRAATADAVRTQNAIAAIGTLVVVGVEATETAVTYFTSDEQDRGRQAAGRAIDLLIKSALAGIDIGHNARTDPDASDASNKQADAKAKYLKLVIKASYSGSQALARLSSVGFAKTRKQAMAEFDAALAAVADAVVYACDASANKLKADDVPDATARANERAATGRYIAGMIRAGASAADMLEAWQRGDSGRLAVCMGLNAVGVGLTTALSEPVAGGVASLEQSATESQSDKDKWQNKFLAAEQRAADQILAEARRRVEAGEAEEDTALDPAISQELHEMQVEAAREALAQLDSEESIAEIQSEVEAELLGVEEFYSTALPDPDAADPAEIAAAHRALDKAMAAGQKLKAQQNMFNMVVDGGLGVLASVYPGASIVVAGKKLAASVVAWNKKADIHNAWVDVAAVALAGQSGTSAAIDNAVHNAKVHKRKATVDGVFAVLNLVAKTASTFDPTGVGLAVAGVTSMAQAVSNVIAKGYGMREVRKGWNAYKDALEDPKNRRVAREALRLNTTLAKCCIAYGATMLNDPAAKQAMTMSGLSIDAIQNDQDICVRLVAYLQAELSDDRKILKVVETDDTTWFPGKPELTLIGWKRFVKAAGQASPPIHASGMDTPAIDRLLAEAAGLDPWDAELDDLPEPGAEDHADAVAQRLAAAEAALPVYQRLEAALRAYRPMEGGTADAGGTGGAKEHSSMRTAADAFATLASWSVTKAENRVRDLATLQAGE